MNHFVTGIAGIWVPCTGIIDYVKATDKMVEIALEINPESKLVLNTEATAFEKENGINIISTNKETYRSRFNIFCGGLQADRLAA